MTCSNCSSQAIYALLNERVSAVYYCGRCLPTFLRAAAAKGQLNIPVEPTSTSKKKPKIEPALEPEAVVEPALEDEPVVAETPLEAEEPETTEA